MTSFPFRPERSRRKLSSFGVWPYTTEASMNDVMAFICCRCTASSTSGPKLGEQAAVERKNGMQPRAPDISSSVCREDSMHVLILWNFKRTVWHSASRERSLPVWFTSMGKHGCIFSHVVTQSTPVRKAVLPELWGVNVMSWSMYWPHSTSSCEYTSSFPFEELLSIFLLTSRGCWQNGICFRRQRVRPQPCLLWPRVAC